MTFKDLKIKKTYRSGESDIGTDFFSELIKHAVCYKRAVGFFSSSSMIETAAGLHEIAKKCGKIKLIVSPKLTEEDVKAISLGYQNRLEIIEKRMLADFNEATTELEVSRLSLLSRLITIGVLDIKVAVLLDQKNVGMYHEKIGYFEDSERNIVSFIGSANDSFSAYKFNFESIMVFKSWEEEERSLEITKYFDQLWDNRTKMVEVIDFPSAVKSKILEYKEEIDINTGQPVNRLEKKIPKIKRPLREYQKEAIRKWFEFGNVGIFDMATGTGKTITALSAIVKLYQFLRNRLATIIVVPYIHLAEQWADEARENFNIDFIIGHSESKDYLLKLESQILDYVAHRTNEVFFITTNASFRTSKVQKVLSLLNEEVLFVADEAHNLGTFKILSLLNQKFLYRLALSATFERYGDKDGTQGLNEYFGEKCIEYPLKKAIKEGMLTRYEYFPHIVILDRDERDDYEELTKKIAQSIVFKKNGEKTYSDYGKSLILKRARLIASAKGKYKVLYEKILDYKNDSHILVYVGTSTVVDKKGDNEEVKQIDYVTDILGNHLGFMVQRYTSRENLFERNEIKQRFEKGNDLQILVAIKCLDEGVDIPSIKTAFILASSTNPREYIQRRGRVLRLHENKTISTIHDFIVLPFPLESSLNKEKVTTFQRMLKNEIRRLEEFGADAENSALAHSVRMKILNDYGFLKFDIIEDEIFDMED